jgi:hypothetical protein
MDQLKRAVQPELCRRIEFVFTNGEIAMAYTVTSDDAPGLAMGPVSETASDLREALSKARQMYETGLVNVSIADQAGHKIDGDELLDCITGKRTITEDLRADSQENSP